MLFGSVAYPTLWRNDDPLSAVDAVLGAIDAAGLRRER